MVTKSNVQIQRFSKGHSLKRVLKNDDIFVRAAAGLRKMLCFTFVAELLGTKDFELGLGLEK